MAPKSQLLPHRSAAEEKEKEPEPSSSDEEDSEAESSGKENSSDETEDGSSEDEEDAKTLSTNKPQTPVSSKPKSKQILPINGWDSGPDSDSGSPKYQPQPIRKPPTLSSVKRPRPESDASPDPQIPVATNKPQMSVSKPKSKQIIPINGWVSDPDSESGSPKCQPQPIRKPSTSSSAKRARPESDASPDPPSSKKLKAEEKASAVSVSGVGIVRLWSDKDEITVLKGMIEFKKLEGKDPNSEGLYNFIKGKLQDKFSKDQLRTKISRMKKKFVNVMKKAENGPDPVFSKPHESMTFELCKKIWGEIVTDRPLSSKKDKTENATKEGSKDDVVTVKAEKVGGQSDMNEENGEEGDFWSKYPNLRMSFENLVGNFPSLAMTEAGASFLKERVSLIGNAKAKEFDEKWRQLVAEVAKLNYKMLSLMTEQVREALNNY